MANKSIHPARKGTNCCVPLCKLVVSSQWLVRFGKKLTTDY
jgi:hypothetical protein